MSSFSPRSDEKIIMHPRDNSEICKFKNSVHDPHHLESKISNTCEFKNLRKSSLTFYMLKIQGKVDVLHSKMCDSWNNCDCSICTQTCVLFVVMLFWFFVVIFSEFGLVLMDLGKTACSRSIKVPCLWDPFLLWRCSSIMAHQQCSDDWVKLTICDVSANQDSLLTP